MGRTKGGKVTVTYDSTKRQPLDSRMLVTKVADLINPTVWLTNTTTTDATYNGMIVSVNSDGEYNGVYYLTDRKAITAENYAAYQAALSAGEDVSQYFSMWTKLSTINDLSAVEGELELIKEQIDNASPSVGLTPVDGTISIVDGGIKVAISESEGNALVAVADGLFVRAVSADFSSGDGIEISNNQISVKLASDTHGLVAVDGAMTLNLATSTADGAMSKEDKAALDTVVADVKTLQSTVSDLNDRFAWGSL